MRICWLVLAFALVACGERAAGVEVRPSPSRTPIPWIDTKAIPTPVPLPSIPPRPAGVRDCAIGDIAGVATRGQGAGGWWVRAVVFGNRSGTPCIVTGPLAVNYLDGAGRIVGAATFGGPTWSQPGWAQLDPATVPIDGDTGSHPGQARIVLQSYGDCEHRELRSITLTFSGGTLRIPTDPQPVGGRCDTAGQEFGLSSSRIGPSVPPPFPAGWELPFSLSIDAPPVAFAGESLRYVLHVANHGSRPSAWIGCPIYVESLTGREMTPTEVPGRAPKPPDRIYRGFAKELYVLNCGPAGPLAPGADVLFEMVLQVPSDAYGLETLTWEVAGPLPGGRATATIEFLPPRR